MYPNINVYGIKRMVKCNMKTGDLFIVTSNNFDDRIYIISKIEDNYIIIKEEFYGNEIKIKKHQQKFKIGFTNFYITKNPKDQELKNIRHKKLYDDFKTKIDFMYHLTLPYEEVEKMIKIIDHYKEISFERLIK